MEEGGEGEGKVVQLWQDVLVCVSCCHPQWAGCDEESGGGRGGLSSCSCVCCCRLWAGCDENSGGGRRRL